MLGRIVQHLPVMAALHSRSNTSSVSKRARHAYPLS
jgi:hypothetical protein